MRKTKSRRKAIFLLALPTLLLCAMACAAKGAALGQGNGVSSHGKLSVQGTKLCAQDNTAVVLRGMSSHGLTWFPEYTNYAAFRTLQNYGANVVRLAVYTVQNDGYLEEPKLNRKLLYAAIENALAADLYVIVDWHVLQDENPLRHMDKAKEFFADVAQRYGPNDAILYEICNEPNGETTYEDIQKYALEVIPVIQTYAPGAVILVGTPKFCTTLEDVIESPLPYDNVMYTYHYYSDVSDCRYARSQITRALHHGIPVFVSEWGYKAESQTLEKDTQDLDAFMDFLGEQEISWVNWALSNKNESYSFISDKTTVLSGWTPQQLTPSGKYVISRLQAEP